MGNSQSERFRTDLLTAKNAIPNQVGHSFPVFLEKRFISEFSGSVLHGSGGNGVELGSPSALCRVGSTTGSYLELALERLSVSGLSRRMHVPATLWHSR